MAVVVETTVGDFTIDLFIDSRPQACKNFLKLCKMKYYNFCLFHSIQSNFLAQTGDPTGSGSGGESVYGLLYGDNARYFEAETMPKLKHNKPGLISMVNCGNNMLGSQFFITLGEELVSLDGEHCVFGEISEGTEIVLKLNGAICDSQYRPYKDIRITHTIILEDPFDDPSGLVIPDMSPEATQERLANGRIGADEEVDETQGLTAEQVEELRQEREAKARATILEIVGDLPDADMAPPENVLFVCKLNPVTTDDDLEIIFSRFGKVKSCEVIRDKNTGDSLQYAFVEFEDQKSCEDAYFKMDNVLIDDRRIHVDFSQSVAKMRWKGKGRGVEYFDSKDQMKDSKNNGTKEREGSRSKVERPGRRERDREYEERERRKDKGRDREDRSREKERERVRDNDDRHRRRDDRERSRSDWRKKDKRDYREDDKRYEKRKEGENSRKREDDSKRVSSSSSSKRVEEKKIENKRLEEKKIDVKDSKDSRFVNGKNSSRKQDSEKSEDVDKHLIKAEKQESLDKEGSKGSKYDTPSHVSFKDETFSDSFNDSQEIPMLEAENDKGVILPATKGASVIDLKTNYVSSRRSSKDDKKPSESIRQEDFENERGSEGRSSLKDEKKLSSLKGSQDKEKKKKLKRKRKESETRKKKRRRYSSSSESSSESSDSSDSSSSSDSSDYKHSKKKKLIVAKRYYRGGKLVKEIKKKKRTKDTSDSESDSEESSDSDSNRKYKSKKRKVSNSLKQGKKKAAHSSEGSQSDSSSSEDSDENSKKRKKKTNEKYIKKKSKHSKKSKRRKKSSSSSSDSEDSVQSKNYNKKQKKVKNPKLSTNLVTTTSE